MQCLYVSTNACYETTTTNSHKDCIQLVRVTYLCVSHTSTSDSGSNGSSGGRVEWQQWQQQ